jgi:hypothetical protein
MHVVPSSTAWPAAFRVFRMLNNDTRLSVDVAPFEHGRFGCRLTVLAFLEIFTLVFSSLDEKRVRNIAESTQRNARYLQ